MCKAIVSNLAVEASQSCPVATGNYRPQAAPTSSLFPQNLKMGDPAGQIWQARRYPVLAGGALLDPPALVGLSRKARTPSGLQPVSAAISGAEMTDGRRKLQQRIFAFGVFSIE